MTEWFKRFSLSLFSDDKAKSSAKFGFGNVLLTSFLAVVFIFLGIYAGETVPFASYYNRAHEFREFLYGAFDTGITVEVDDNKAVISRNGESVDINSLSDEEDARYYVNGYHLFVNSANVVDAFDDFEAYCVGEGGEIDYEKYLALGESEKKNYRFAVRYTGRVKEITDVEGYLQYLKGLNSEEINNKLKELEGTDNYKRGVYALYVQSYYPDMSSAAGEAVPTLRNYYYLQTLKTDGKYLCLFGDMIVGSFSAGGNKISYGGMYKQGNALDGRDSVDEFIKGTFYDASSATFILGLVNGVSVIAFTELITVGVMLLGFAVCKLRKKGACRKFADSARIVASYAHVAALIAAVVTLCLSFAFAAASIIAYLSFAIILIIRTVVLIIRDRAE